MSGKDEDTYRLMHRVGRLTAGPMTFLGHGLKFYIPLRFYLSGIERFNSNIQSKEKAVSQALKVAC